MRLEIGKQPVARRFSMNIPWDKADQTAFGWKDVE